MPLYEYECLKCGTRFEQIQKFSDPPLAEHEGCGGEVRKLLSAPAIQFKGSGWYITDYARAGKSGDGKEKKEKKETKSEKAEAASGSDAKPASSETAKPAAEASKT
jgi:putative FmdB family regulatory protein